MARLTLRAENLDYSEGRIQQKGMGDQVLCGRCNSFLGREYVIEYRDWARWGMLVLRHCPPAADFVRATVLARKPLRFLKQCVAMILCSNDPAFVDGQPALRKFVLDPREKYLPPDLDVYLTLYRSKKARRVGIMGGANLQTHTVGLFSEVAFPPFGVLFVLASSPEDRFGRITEFRHCDLDETRDVQLDLLIGEAHTPYPGDYRTRAQVEREANRDLEDSA